MFYHVLIRYLNHQQQAQLVASLLWGFLTPLAFLLWGLLSTPPNNPLTLTLLAFQTLLILLLLLPSVLTPLPGTLILIASLITAFSLTTTLLLLTYHLPSLRSPLPPLLLLLLLLPGLPMPLPLALLFSIIAILSWLLTICFLPDHPVNMGQVFMSVSENFDEHLIYFCFLLYQMVSWMAVLIPGLLLSFLLRFLLREIHSENGAKMSCSCLSQGMMRRILVFFHFSAFYLILCLL